jgi:hypothetical protein
VNCSQKPTIYRAPEVELVFGDGSRYRPTDGGGPSVHKKQRDDTNSIHSMSGESGVVEVVDALHPPTATIHLTILTPQWSPEGLSQGWFTEEPAQCRAHQIILAARVRRFSQNAFLFYGKAGN